MRVTQVGMVTVLQLSQQYEANDLFYYGLSPKLLFYCFELYHFSLSILQIYLHEELAMMSIFLGLLIDDYSYHQLL